MSKDKIASLLKELSDKSLLLPGYESDLEFLKSACKAINSSSFWKNTSVFINALDGLQSFAKVYKVTNWYVLLSFVPDITTSNIRYALLNWIENSVTVSRYLERGVLDLKIPDYIDSISGNLKKNSNIKW